MIESLILLLLAAPSPPTGGEPAQDTLNYVVRMAEVPVGSLTSITTSLEENGSIRREHSRITLARDGQEIRFEEETLYREDREGRLLRFEIIRSGLGPSDWIDTLEKVESGWRRFRDRGGASVIDTIASEEMLGPVGTDRLLASPDSITITDLNPVEMMPRTVHAAFLRADTLGRESTPVACNVFMLDDSAGDGTTLQWRDRNGKLLREEEETLGWVIEVDYLTAATELQHHDRQPLETLDWGHLVIDGAVPDEPPCSFLMMPIDTDAEQTDEHPLPNGPGQVVETGPTPGSLRIRLDRPTVPRTVDDDRNAWQADSTLTNSLRSGLMVDVDGPGIRDFANAAVEGSSGPTEEALALERAVHSKIRILDFRTVFATASQTLRDRRGDCTEHAILLAACCRARDIPARLVAGMVPTGGRMMFHLWTEVFLGRWIGLDATLGQGRVAPCAIAIHRWEQPEDGMAELNRSVTRLLGRYRLQVVDPE